MPACNLRSPRIRPLKPNQPTQHETRAHEGQDHVVGRGAGLLSLAELGHDTVRRPRLMWTTVPPGKQDLEHPWNTAFGIYVDPLMNPIRTPDPWATGA